MFREISDRQKNKHFVENDQRNISKIAFSLGHISNLSYNYGSFEFLIYT